MVGTKNNRRTIYTKTVIKEEFLTILEKKELGKVTVTEICKAAHINRGTFYLHYRDPYDLFEQIEAELITQIVPLIMVESKDISEWLQVFLTVIKENEKATKLILSDYKNSQLLSSILFKVHDLAIYEFSHIFQEEDPELLEYYFSYFVAGTIGIISEWLEKGQQISVEKIGSVIVTLIMRATH